MTQNLSNRNNISQKGSLNRQVNISSNKTMNSRKKSTSQNLYSRENRMHRNFVPKKIGPNSRRIGRPVHKGLKQQVPMNRVVIPQKIIPSSDVSVNKNTKINISNDTFIENNKIINSSLVKNYTLKEIISLGIDVSKTKKVFVNGESRYVLDETSISSDTAENINSNVINSFDENKEIKKVHPYFENQETTHDVLEADQIFKNDEDSSINDLHYDYEQEIEEQNTYQEEYEDNQNSTVIGNMQIGRAHV